MKNFLITGMLLFFCFNVQENRTTETDEERQFLLNYYDETFMALQESLKGLTAEQLAYNPSDSEWSISECLEHIILTEQMLFGMNKELLDKPANPERRLELKTADKELIRIVTDRSNKAKTPEDLLAKRKYQDAQSAMKDLENLRHEIALYIKSRPVKDFRDRVSDSPFGPLDGYQSMLFLAGHTARHTLQIREIRSAAGFYSE